MIRRFLDWILIAALILFFYNGAARALRAVVMTGGGAVKAGSRATLRCSYDLEGALLYSIRWYRNQDEFYRYVPKESPPTMVFSLPGVHVDLSASNDQRVTLTSVHRQLAGIYFCEVSADAPLFHTEIQSTRLDVVDVPQSAPILTIDRSRYSAGDSVRANCSSPLSYPPANITWYLNGEKVNKTYTTTIPLNPDLWEASSSFSVIEIGTEDQIHHPRYQVGGSQQEISSSQLKIPSSSPEITVYTAYSPIPSKDIFGETKTQYYDSFESRNKEEDTTKKDIVGVLRKDTETNMRDYPLRVNTIPLKVTRIRMQPGLGSVLKLKCEATIYDVYKASSEIFKIREETPHIALVMGHSSAGSIYAYFKNQTFIVWPTSLHLFVIWKILLSTR